MHGLAGALIAKNELRFGVDIPAERDVTYWYHCEMPLLKLRLALANELAAVGCMTKSHLSQLAALGLDTVPGFQDLHSDDQERVRAAVGVGKGETLAEVHRRGDAHDWSCLPSRCL